jgi:hypothetical protein
MTACYHSGEGRLGQDVMRDALRTATRLEKLTLMNLTPTSSLFDAMLAVGLDIQRQDVRFTAYQVELSKGHGAKASRGRKIHRNSPLTAWRA